MRKIISILIFFTLTQSAFSIFDVAVDGGYIGTAVTDISTLGTTNLDGTGYIVNGAGHFNFGFPAIVTFGVGPTASFGNQKLTGARSNYANSQDMIRIGAEVYVQLDVLRVIKPYVKAGLGKDFLYNTSTSSTASTVIKSQYGDLYYTFMLGINLPLNSLLSFYAQGGPTGGTRGGGTMTSLTFNGVSQPVSTNPETIAYSGFLITGGVMLSF